MNDKNVCLFTGRLTEDPTVKYTSSKKAVCNFRIAVNKSYKKGDEWVQTAQFFTVVAWEKLAEDCGKHLVKGKPITVLGELQTRVWEDKGTKKYITEIHAESVGVWLGGTVTQGQVEDKMAESSIPF